MTPEELNTLEDALTWADGYFTSYCEFADISVHSQEEIDSMDDEIEQEQAQEARDYEDLLFKAQQIIKKYRKEI